VTCEQFVELVTAYLEGTLDAGTERRFVEHIAVCDGCERYLDQIRRTVEELGRLPAESLTPESRDHLLAAFRDWSAR
jgi:anti-sigma factor RsiW